MLRSHALLLVAPLALAGCLDETFGPVCGAGTVEKDGSCVPDHAPPTSATCGSGTALDGGACVPTATTETPSLDGLIAYACRANRCVASLVVDYWNKQTARIDGSTWDDHAVKRTISLLEVGGRMGPSGPEFDQLVYRVSDGAGGTWDCKDGAACEGLTFQAGMPVTLTIRQIGGNISAHYFSAARFYRTVAWRDAASVNAVYRAPAFDSFGAKKGTSTSSVAISFVPMTTGAFDGYCHLGVTNGSRFAEIVEGTVEPNYATGHAGDGMYTDVVVEDSSGRFDNLTFVQDQLPNRDPAFDKDSRTGTPWWTMTAVNGGLCCTPMTIDMTEVSETEYAYRVGGIALSEVNPLVLLTDHGYQLTFQNTSDMRNHRFASPQLLEQSLMRRAEDSAADVRAPYLTELEVAPGKEALLSIIPLVAARFASYCSIGVRTGANGAVDLHSGHAGSGMRAPISVLTSTRTSTRS